MQLLHALAKEIGLVRTWWDADGEEQTVSDASLVAIATALGYPAGSEKDIAASLKLAQERAALAPKMIVTRAGTPTRLPLSLSNATLHAHDGTAIALDLSGWVLPEIHEPGYYQLSVNGHDLTLAVAPAKCPSIEALGKGRIWGPAVQIPALRGESAKPFGTFAELAQAVDLFASAGADAVAINPVHALFAGHGRDFSPYSPSSRRYLNGAMGDPALLGLPSLPVDQDGSEGALIDWEAALPCALQHLRTLFANLDDNTRQRIVADNAAFGDGLQQQALFDALDMHFRAKGHSGWQSWPKRYRKPGSKAVAAFAHEHADEVEFHLFTQWLARESLASVQARAKQGGMAVGLLADLAVGVHTGGADAWTMRDTMLTGLTIGAPPDPLGPLGQNWMLTTFSPHGLAQSGYRPWIETIRAALATSGALRIDHAFGMARLWVVPEGHPSSEGAYLTYPRDDLLGLVALEAHLAGALVVAEDLGTMPKGFGPALAAQGMLGMRVLWFERAKDDGFLGAQDYDVKAVAMTGTHDTATIAGWWTGRDLEWGEKLGRLPQGFTLKEAAQKRAWERGLLWATLTHDVEPRPAPDNPAPVVEAALRHIGSTPCELAIVPLEDLLAEPEQPNMPGTTMEHPNWRRRLDAPLSALLKQPDTAHRLSVLNEARRQPSAR